MSAPGEKAQPLIIGRLKALRRRNKHLARISFNEIKYQYSVGAACMAIEKHRASRRQQNAKCNY